jgi:hypothetical protein
VVVVFAAVVVVALRVVVGDGVTTGKRVVVVVSDTGTSVVDSTNVVVVGQCLSGFTPSSQWGWTRWPGGESARAVNANRRTPTSVNPATRFTLKKRAPPQEP